MELSDTNHPEAPASARPPMPAITAPMVEYLRQTKPWVRFLSILGFLAMGVMLLVGLLLMFGAGLLSAVTNSEFGGFEAILIGFIYVVLAVLYLFPVYYLYRFADGIKKMFHVDLEIGMEEALNYQKSFWRFVGILTLIFIIFQVAAMGVILVFVVLGAIGASSGQL